MRIGMPLVDGFDSPEDWIKKLQARHCRAAYCPAEYEDSAYIKDEYIQAAKENDIVIAEVGAWSNMTSFNQDERQKAFNTCVRQLKLAEYMGANCCVTTTGYTGIERGANSSNLSKQNYELIVKTVQRIIDEVKPQNTFFTLELMPWALPDSIECYLDFMRDIDRSAFAVHYDPVNIITSYRKYVDNTEFLQQSIRQLGPYIKSTHAKDIANGNAFPIELYETAPGKGALDYVTYITEIDRIDRDIPMMLEHLHTDKEYTNAAEYILSQAKM